MGSLQHWQRKSTRAKVAQNVASTPWDADDSHMPVYNETLINYCVTGREKWFPACTLVQLFSLSWKQEAPLVSCISYVQLNFFNMFQFIFLSSSDSQIHNAMACLRGYEIVIYIKSIVMLPRRCLFNCT